MDGNALVNDHDIDILIGDLQTQHGYDFSNYSRASLKRRINHIYTTDKHVSFAEFRYKVRNSKEYLRHFVEQITVNVTEMFRDPLFYKKLKEEVLPVLATHPFIKVWHAGCSTGEEVYSMAILLKEANLLQKSLLYATDLNPTVIEKARTGIFSLSQMKQYSENYLQAGGKEDFSSYYTARYDKVIFDKTLRDKMVFAMHNLVSDVSFNEFQIILCRNVLIYFDKNLQDKVFTLFDNSLDQLGYLALGSRETLRFSPTATKYKQLEGKEKIWRKLL